MVNGDNSYRWKKTFRLGSFFNPFYQVPLFTCLLIYFLAPPNTTGFLQMLLVKWFPFKSIILY